MRYTGLKPASARASRAARGSSKKRDTAPEVKLRKALRDQGLRGYRIDRASLPGRPDVVFARERVAVFCDGDFWHGRNLEERLAKLERGHNAPYWVAKIDGNVARDRRNDAALEAAGWAVLRFWESNVARDPSAAAEQVKVLLQTRSQISKKSRGRSG